MEANENVKSVTFNWHQAGSTQDRDGAGEDWERVTVGMNGVLKITEYIPTNGDEKWNYYVETVTGENKRIFNANFVEYFAPSVIS